MEHVIIPLTGTVDNIRFLKVNEDSITNTFFFLLPVCLRYMLVYDLHSFWKRVNARSLMVCMIKGSSMCHSCDGGDAESIPALFTGKSCQREKKHVCIVLVVTDC